MARHPSRGWAVDAGRTTFVNVVWGHALVIYGNSEMNSSDSFVPPFLTKMLIYLFVYFSTSSSRWSLYGQSFSAAQYGCSCRPWVFVPPLLTTARYPEKVTVFLCLVSSTTLFVEPRRGLVVRQWHPGSLRRECIHEFPLLLCVGMFCDVYLLS